MIRIAQLALLVLVAASPALARKPATIGTLDKRAVSVEPGAAPAANFGDAITSYRAFLELASPDDPLRMQALRRLADLELARREERVMNGEPADPGAPNPVDLYRALLEGWPDQAGNDAVIYQLARACELDGDIDSALAALDTLVVRYPDSPHIAEAQFRRGETLFSARRFHDAEKAYAAVIEVDSAGAFASQSYYKLGWSLYRQSMYPQAVDAFLTVMDRQLAGGGPVQRELEAKSRAERELIDDTRRVLALSFASLPGPDPLAAHLDQSAPRRYEYLLYSRQGDLYLEQERYSDAAGIYSAFVSRRPEHDRAPHLQMQAISAYEAGGFADQVLAGKRQFVEHYGLDAPFWATRTPAGAPEVHALLKANITDLARHYHAKAQHDGAGYAPAIHWYRTFLRYFPAEPEAPGAQFLLAELVHDSGDPAAAAIEYQRAAYDYGMHDKAAEAGYAAILAFDEAAATSADPGPLRQARIDTGLRFVDTFPAHPQAAAVMTASAEALFDAGELARAVDAAARIGGLASASAAQRVTGLVVTGHAQFDLGAFALAEPAYRQALAMVDQTDDRQVALTERLAATIYKQGELAREGGDLLAAASHFLRVATETPGATIRAGADYDAAVAFVELGDNDGAIPVLEAFRASHQGHALQSDVTRRLAAAYMATGKLGAAADEMVRIAGDDAATDAVRRDALLEAADLYARAQRTDEVRHTLTDYLARYPTPAAEAMETRLKLADLATGAGDTAGRQHWLEQMVRAFDSGEAQDERARTLAARASLELAEPRLLAFELATLSVPLAESLAVKRALMNEALAACERAASYRVSDVTTAATHAIGKVYLGLSEALMASERPPELSAEELEQYDILLEEQAFPIEEKAIQIFEANAARAAEGIFDEWVIASYVQLAGLLPVRYAKIEQGVDVVTTIH